MATTKTATKTSTKLYDLALADLSKDEKSKKAEALTEAVEDNKKLFEDTLYNAKKSVKAAKKAQAALYKKPTATPEDIMEATDNVALAERTVERITAIIAKRF